MKRAKERLANMLKHKSLWLIGALSHLFLGSCEIVCHLRYETPPPIIIFLSFLLFVLSGNALLHIRLSQSKRNTAILLAIPLFSHFLSIYCLL